MTDIRRSDKQVQKSVNKRLTYIYLYISEEVREDGNYIFRFSLVKECEYLYILSLLMSRYIGRSDITCRKGGTYGKNTIRIKTCIVARRF